MLEMYPESCCLEILVDNCVACGNPDIKPMIQ